MARINTPTDEEIVYDLKDRILSKVIDIADLTEESPDTPEMLQHYKNCIAQDRRVLSRHLKKLQKYDPLAAETVNRAMSLIDTSSEKRKLIVELWGKEWR